MNPLRKWRNAHHLTANKVANELGVTERTVLAYETGAFNPSNIRLSAIAYLMQTDFEALDAEWAFWRNSCGIETS